MEKTSLICGGTSKTRFVLNRNITDEHKNFLRVLRASSAKYRSHVVNDDHQPVALRFRPPPCKDELKTKVRKTKLLPEMP